MDILQWLNDTLGGEFCFTLLVSMIPVIELRGGIPFGVGVGLPVWLAYLAAVIGNMLPVPFIVVYIRRIFQWMRRHLPRLNHLVTKLEQKAHLKGQKVTKYKYRGLDGRAGGGLPGHAPAQGSALHFRRGPGGRYRHQHSYLRRGQPLLTLRPSAA